MPSLYVFRPERSNLGVSSSANTLSFSSEPIPSFFTFHRVAIANRVGKAYRDLTRERTVFANQIERLSNEVAIPYERC